MFSEFMVRALLSGLGVAVLTGVLGCFVIWRRMVYFGDALSHAAILGVVGAIALNVSVYFGVIALALILSVLLFSLTSRVQGADVILGVFAQTGLALGLIGASIWGRGLSIEAILFGDILAVRWQDILFIWLGVAIIMGILLWRWNQCITATLGDDLAASVGVDARRESFYLAVLLAVVVGLALKIVGALLITAFLIIPAATARRFTSTPEGMAAVAIVIGCASSAFGLWGAYIFDWPAGPSMVAMAAVFFGLSQMRPVS